MWIKYKWEAETIDIEKAFLYGNLEKEIYLKIPDVYKKYTSKKNNKNDFLILDQAIYGLVQAARQFFKKLIEVLEKKMTFVPSMNDQCLLMRNDQKGTIIVCLYIDDTIYVGDKKALDTFKKEIKEYFVTKEEGRVEHYGQCMIKRINGGILLHQSDLIKKIELQFEQEIKDIRGYRTPGASGKGSIRVKDDDVCITEKGAI